MKLPGDVAIQVRGMQKEELQRVVEDARPVGVSLPLDLITRLPARAKRARRDGRGKRQPPYPASVAMVFSRVTVWCGFDVHLNGPLSANVRGGALRAASC